MTVPGKGDRYPKVGGRTRPSQNRPALRDRPHLPPHLPHLRAPPPALVYGAPRHLAAHLRPARPGPSPRPPACAAPCAQPALGAARRPRATAARAIAPPPLGGHNGAAAALLMHMHDAAPPAPPPRPEQQSPERCSRGSGRGECRPAWPGWAGAGPGRRQAAVQEVQCARPAPCVPSAPLRPRRRRSPVLFLLLSTGAGPNGGGAI
uniref:atherin-like n=1 Tax=Arvicanthis niloticus TaxID=61156 RepID=UPI001487610F|nr:atherin-like [Arvicanthis niloticus]